MWKKHKKLILAVAVPALGLIIFSAFAKKSEPPLDTLYRTGRVEINQLRVAVEATGTLKPVMVVNVGTQVSGTVEKIYIDYNDKVKEGQPLLTLDEAPFTARVKQSQANVNSAAARLKVVEVKLARYQRLYSGRTATKEELEQVEADRDVAKADLQQQEAQLDIDEYNLKNARIVSPIDGVVINKMVDVGQTVAASFQTPTLLEIAQDLSKMQIDASFAEADIGQIKPGLKATFTVDTFPSQTFAGTVRQVRLNPTTEQSVVTYNVVVDVDNPDLKLLPGMTAYVNIVLHQEDKALLVPNSALNFRPAAGEVNSKAEKPEPPAGKTVKEGQVYVLTSRGLRETPLLLGATDLRQSVVLGGELKAGDTVILGAKTANGGENGGRKPHGPF